MNFCRSWKESFANGLVEFDGCLSDSVSIGFDFFVKVGEFRGEHFSEDSFDLRVVGEYHI